MTDDRSTHEVVARLKKEMIRLAKEIARCEDRIKKLRACQRKVQKEMYARGE